MPGRSRFIPCTGRSSGPTRLVSKKHATLTVQADASVLATGDKPNNDVDDIDLETSVKGITVLRLEVLNDASLPAGGPGRAPLFQVGDFLLTEFVLTSAPAPAGGKPGAVPFRRATEDYAARGRSAAMAIDGISDTGWSVIGQVGRPHAAVFELKDWRWEMARKRAFM